MKVLFTATGISTGGRTGTVRNEDGSLELTLARPKEAGGPGGGSNPEELFAFGYSACFASTLDHLARQRKLTLDQVHVTARVGLVVNDSGRYGLQVELDVALPSLSAEVGDELLEATHQTCPYSHATRGNVDVKVTRVA